MTVEDVAMIAFWAILLFFIGALMGPVCANILVLAAAATLLLTL